MYCVINIPFLHLSFKCEMKSFIKIEKITVEPTHPCLVPFSQRKNPVRPPGSLTHVFNWAYIDLNTVKILPFRLIPLRAKHSQNFGCAQMSNVILLINIKQQHNIIAVHHV